MISIVIPTYNHCDYLLNCLESIIQYTDLNHVEVIVVANGCTDGTHEYVNSLGHPFKLIAIGEAIGYPRAVNIGIMHASSDYIVLLNNDTVLLPQPRTNYWLDLLLEPFFGQNVGITGPVKFTWECGHNKLTAMAFWLVVIKREVFEKIGLLDEIFSPGMGEDGDFCERAIRAGYRLVSVPEDVAGEFDEGIKNFNFPIYHVGNGTFADDVSEKEAVIERNNMILARRYGKIKTSIIIPTYNHFEDAFAQCFQAAVAFTDLADKEIIVVANGCNEPGIDGEDRTRRLVELYQKTCVLGSHIKLIWFDEPIGVVRAYNAGIKASIGKRIVLLDNDSILQTQRVDTWIDILEKPFNEDPETGASGPFANHYDDLGLVLHSGCVMYDAQLLISLGGFDEVYNPGYMSDGDISVKITAASRKVVEVPERIDNKPYENGVFAINFPVVHTGQVQTMNKAADVQIIRKNRAILYHRYGKQHVKYSIIIPTFNHYEDLLKPCIESLFKYTDMTKVQLIVVANGCTDGTKAYLDSLDRAVDAIYVADPIGYTKAINLGLQVATGNYIVLLNNDTELLPQSENQWLEMLEQPFADPTVGLTGPLMLHDDYANFDVLIFFCTMIKAEVFQKIGVLDEIFSPGGGEDIDFTVRATRAGYKAVAVDSAFDPVKSTNVGNVPIWHKDNKTFGEIPEYTNHIVKRNGLINCKRYNKNIKLNLGSGGVSYPGYLSVDLYDKRAHVPMDITKLDFDDDSVTEILASHVFEHLNPYHSLAILSEWRRVLKPGGKLIMEMPDIEALCKRFVTASTGERYGILNAIYGSVNTTDVGGPDNITSPHLFGWWPQSLRDHLTNAGYVNIEFMNEKIPHPESNLRVEAMKPIIITGPTSAPGQVTQRFPVGPMIVTKQSKFNHEALKAQEPATYYEIFKDNSYALYEPEIQNSVVIDIGANLGLFTFRCLELGARRVIAVEAQATVFYLGLLPNMQGRILSAEDRQRVDVIHKAIYHEDGKILSIPNDHVGSKLVSTGEGENVETITLQSLLNMYDLNSEQDLVLKLDCEGSEFDALMPASVDTIRKFKVIHLEIHANTNPNLEWKDNEVLRERLRSCGFKRASHVPILLFWDNNPIGQDMGIHVEKWVRQ